MKIFTSYYSKISRNPRGLVPIQISTSKPDWFLYACEELTEVYPGWDLVMGIKNKTISVEEYTSRYLKKLELLNKEVILERLQEISKNNNNRDLVLLCYETPDKFCHRHLLAQWLNCNVLEVD